MTMTTTATSSESASQANGSAGPTAGAASKPKRKRGPNKPKPGTIEVRTEASMSQAEIVKLLAAHATGMLGADAGADMELQVNAGDGWRPIDPSSKAVVRFATKNLK